MRKAFLIVNCIYLIILSACVEQRQEPVASHEQPAEIVMPADEKTSILQVDERLVKADSLVIVFYKDPHGPDSLRYTRFYKQFSVTDTSFIRLLMSQLTGKATKLEKMRSCRSEGKIWCFSGGDIIQTIYFSNFSQECNFLYIIKHGFFYYSPLLPGFSKSLYAYKKYAKEPLNQPVE